jgi:ABC-2 type transport system permease protein
MGIVAAFAKTAEQAGNLQSMIAVGLAMLGGIFFPASLGTGILSYLAYISPHRWFLLGLNDLAGGGGIGVIVPSLFALVVFGLVTGGMALLRLRKGVSV